ncbi:hypothetical protein ACFQE5_01850 [Pseudonocardia hispaniensis]|uniref:Uncharacterized protein n=1 Tax=Pseudonocardia hispaniensis TaxID=904933 RepID=A0ABW1IWW8_9PSEU
MSDADIDYDAILAQQQEATGNSELGKTTFKFADQVWSIPHPLLADDEWKAGLQDLRDDGAGDVEVAEYHMGAEQWERFKAAGGRSGIVFDVFRRAAQQMVALDGEGRPTRRSTSSARRRKR